MLLHVKNSFDFSIFLFSLKIMQIRPLLLAEAGLEKAVKLFSAPGIFQPSVQNNVSQKNKYCFTRTNDALLSLHLLSKLRRRETNFVSQSTEDYASALFKEYRYLEERGLKLN